MRFPDNTQMKHLKMVDKLYKRSIAKQQQINRAKRNDTREKYKTQYIRIQHQLSELNRKTGAVELYGKLAQNRWNRTHYPFNTPMKNTDSSSGPKPSKLNNVNIQGIMNAKFPFNTPKRKLNFSNAINASSTPSSPVRKLKSPKKSPSPKKIPSPKKSPSPKKIPSPKKSPVKDNINRMVNSFIRNKK